MNKNLSNANFFVRLSTRSPKDATLDLDEES